MTARDVIVASAGGIGHITLNRPKALHALTLAMCREIMAALQAWESDPAISAIVIDHSEGRGFCAGGDVRQLYGSLRGDGQGVLDFFRTEYRMNHLLFTLQKPVTCIMDGVVMGGGAGLAMPSRFRVATEATQYAMPETGIGLFPDVGGGWFLSRLPGRIGKWLALTGARLDGADCLALGLATHYAPRAALPEFKAGRLPSLPPPPARIGLLRSRIDHLFFAERIEDIIAALRSDASKWAHEQLAEIAKKSPLSSKVALRQLRESRTLSQFSDNMRMEFRIVARLIAKPDFVEGVRAFVIDKDNRPSWSPQRFEDVTDDEVDAIFAPLPEEQEWTPLKR